MTSPERFEYHLTILQDKLRAAQGETNVGLAFFNSGVRTQFFMLEALSRLYGKLHNKKKFEELKEYFKEVEDALGAIDHFDALIKENTDQTGFPSAILRFLQASRTEKIVDFEDLLKKNKWIGNKRTIIDSIRRILADVDWLDPDIESEKIGQFYRKAISKLHEFQPMAEAGFTEIEEQVHDFRRRLRWLSIYPQALRGSIQLNHAAPVPRNLEKYMTPDVLNSPYNTLPAGTTLRPVLLLNKPEFLAMSWMINELGKIKDGGLKVLEYTSAIEKTEKIKASAAVRQALMTAGPGQSSVKELLQQASKLCVTFFEDKVLDRLVHGVSRNQQPEIAENALA